MYSVSCWSPVQQQRFTPVTLHILLLHIRKDGAEVHGGHFFEGTVTYTVSDTVL